MGFSGLGCFRKHYFTRKALFFYFIFGEGIGVWNMNNSRQTTWKARLSIEDIEKITEKFIQLLLKK